MVSYRPLYYPVLELTAEPFALNTYAAASDADIIGFDVIIAQEIEEYFFFAAQAQLERIDEPDEKGICLPGADKLYKKIENALEYKKYTFIRHALQSYICTKANSFTL